MALQRRCIQRRWKPLPTPTTAIHITLLILLALMTFSTLEYSHLIRGLPCRHTSSSLPSFRSASVNITEARLSFGSWIRHLRATTADGVVHTARTACRELEAGAQTCVFDGLVCADVRNTVSSARPTFLFVDDGEEDGSEVAHDHWCELRHVSADPRYFSTRVWPIPNDTFAPRQSCLVARYTSFYSLFPHATDLRTPLRIRWLPSLHHVHLEFPHKDHNNHLLKDIAWILDSTLFQDSLHPPPRSADYGNAGEFQQPAHIYLPQSRAQFELTTSRDVNRLVYSLVLRKDLHKLYPQISPSNLRSRSETHRYTATLTEAFPELLQKQQVLFHSDIRDDSSVDFVCAARLTAGARLANLGHERVCRHMRERGYALYGVERPPNRQVGFADYPQPPKSVLVLDRHTVRHIANAPQLVHALETQFGGSGVVVEYVNTSQLVTAEDYVRIFSRAGIVIAPHGSQNMGVIWMQRYRYDSILVCRVFSVRVYSWYNVFSLQSFYNFVFIGRSFRLLRLPTVCWSR